MPDSLGELPTLKRLYLSKNQISSLPESFLHLRKLRTLDLTDNPKLAKEFQEKITASQEKCDVLLHKMITLKSVANKSLTASTKRSSSPLQLVLEEARPSTKRSSSPLQLFLEEARPSEEKQLQDALAKNKQLESRVAALEAQIVRMQGEHQEALNALQKKHEAESNL